MLAETRLLLGPLPLKTARISLRAKKEMPLETLHAWSGSCPPGARLQSHPQGFTQSAKSRFPCVVRISALQDIKMESCRSPVDQALPKGHQMVGRQVLHRFRHGNGPLQKTQGTTFKAHTTAAHRLVHHRKTGSASFNTAGNPLLEKMEESSPQGPSDIFKDHMAQFIKD